MKQIQLETDGANNSANGVRLRSMRDLMWVAALGFFFIALLLLPTTGLVITLLNLPIWSLVLPSLAFFFFAAAAYFARSFVPTVPVYDLRQIFGLSRGGDASAAESRSIQAAIQQLDALFDDAWTLYYPVSLGDRSLDAVLLGEGGVFGLTIMGLDGVHRFTGALWEWQTDQGEWVAEAENPYVEMTKNGRFLWFHFQDQKIVAPVYDRLVWLGDNLTISQPSDRQRVWYLPDGEVGILADVTNHAPLASNIVSQIDQLLRGERTTAHLEETVS